MRKSGVSKLKAKIMYAAVYHFGPRWEKLLPGEVDPTLGSSGLGISSSIDLSETPTDFDVLEWRIGRDDIRSEEHTSELQSLMRSSYAVFCLKKKKKRSTYYLETIQ